MTQHGWIHFDHYINENWLSAQPDTLLSAYVHILTVTYITSLYLPFYTVCCLPLEQLHMPLTQDTEREEACVDASNTLPYTMTHVQCMVCKTCIHQIHFGEVYTNRRDDWLFHVHLSLQMATTPMI